MPRPRSGKGASSGRALRSWCEASPGQTHPGSGSRPDPGFFLGGGTGAGQSASCRHHGTVIAGDLDRTGAAVDAAHPTSVPSQTVFGAFVTFGNPGREPWVSSPPLSGFGERDNSSDCAHSLGSAEIGRVMSSPDCPGDGNPFAGGEHPRYADHRGGVCFPAAGVVRCTNPCFGRWGSPSGGATVCGLPEWSDRSRWPGGFVWGCCPEWSSPRVVAPRQRMAARRF